MLPRGAENDAGPIGFLADRRSAPIFASAVAARMAGELGIDVVEGAR